MLGAWERGAKLWAAQADPSSAPPHPCLCRMTVKLGDSGGEDGLKKLGKRPAEEDSLEGEAAGAGDAAQDDDGGGGTKRDGKSPRDGGEGPPDPPGPSSSAAGPQDQHHFLRSSVRPQSKRPRKDSPCAVGSGGPGPRGKGRRLPADLMGLPGQDPREGAPAHTGLGTQSCFVFMPPGRYVYVPSRMAGPVVYTPACA